MAHNIYSMEKKKLKVLITGGCRGLGRAIAENLYKQGHEVFIFDKSDKSKIDPSYSSIITGYFQCDISRSEETEACFKILIDRIDRIDVLINNASGKKFKKFEEFQTSEIRENINIEFLAPVILSNLCLQIMKRNNFGRIINISSISAYRVHGFGTIYCSCKRALISFGEALSKEFTDLKGAITVNTICPDSFSQLDGTNLKSHSFITKSVLLNVNRIIQSDLNGNVFHIFTFRHRLKEFYHSVKLALQMLVS
jgi:3-hydroxybutyrate dehydrogenase